MARYGKNHVEGKAAEGRSGWRARRDKARRKRRRSQEERAEINAARRAVATEQETGFNPEAQGGDFVASLSDADLVALYKQLNGGRAPAPKAKRPAVERAVRAKLAEQAAREQQEPTMDLTQTVDGEGDV